MSELVSIARVTTREIVSLPHNSCMLGSLKYIHKTVTVSDVLYKSGYFKIRIRQGVVSHVPSL